MITRLRLECPRRGGRNKWGQTDPLMDGELVIQTAVPVNRAGT